MKDYFKLAENKTDVKTEILAGFTTFFTMAYIIFVNPAILSNAGMDYQAVLFATCVAAGIGSLVMGLYANYPFAQAPGMGLNAFFTYTVVLSMGYSWQQALGLVFISGMFFMVITLTGTRAWLIEGIPTVVRHAMPAGIGLFIALIGLNNAGIIRVNQGPIFDILFGQEGATAASMAAAIKEAPAQVLELGSLSNPSVQLALAGLFITAVLVVMEKKTAFLVGMLATTALGFPLGVAEWPSFTGIEPQALTATVGQLDLAGLWAKTAARDSLLDVLIAIIALVISFSLVDLFDTIGTLIGTASKGGFLDASGKLPRANKALMADAIATTAGAWVGTSTVTTYIESSSGIVAGGRTGLTAVVVALLFFASVFLAPFAVMVPAAATAPVLILVGMMMMGSLKKIDFDHYEEAIPAFLLVILMPLTYSIANGIAAGMIFYTVVKVAKGKFREIHPMTWALSVIFLLRFILL
jgi:AGZA family xanthine/uracil permease-like MFS transporter